MAYVSAGADFFPASLPNDGLFDLVCVDGTVSRRKAMAVLLSVETGTHFELPQVCDTSSRLAGGEIDTCRYHIAKSWGTGSYRINARASRRSILVLMESGYRSRHFRQRCTVGWELCWLRGIFMKLLGFRGRSGQVGFGNAMEVYRVLVLLTYSRRIEMQRTSQEGRFTFYTALDNVSRGIGTFGRALDGLLLALDIS